MKQAIKNLLATLTIILIVSLSGCEKDIYEDGLQQTSKPKKATQQYISISEAKQLIPEIQKYNRAYDYLSGGNFSSPSGREAEELDLDLNHILKVTEPDGKETFSISIKKAFDEYEDIFFENLHIFEKDGSFTSKILKYNPLDDSKAFDMKTFSGSIEIYDRDRNLEAVVQYEDGIQRCQKVDIGCLHIWYFDGIDELWIWYQCFGGSSGENPSDQSGAPGDDGSGTGLGTGSNGPGDSGNDAPTQTNPNPDNHIHISPNSLWPEITSHIDMANRIYNRLHVNDTSLRTFLRNPSNTVTEDVYEYMQPLSSNTTISMSIIKDGIKNLSTGGALFNTWTYNDQITANLDPCVFTILQSLKTSQNGEFGKVIQKFAGYNPVPQNFNWEIVSGTLDPRYMATTQKASSILAKTTINEMCT